MKTSKIRGIALILFGFVAIGYYGITYTTLEKALDVGPLEPGATNKSPFHFRLFPGKWH
jgi:hypothetical protein